MSETPDEQVERERNILRSILEDLGIDPDAPVEVDPGKRGELAAVWANNPLPQSRVDKVIGRLPNVFELWDDYYKAETPVAQASALIEFSNALTHMRWEYDGDLEDDE